jgi:tRNA-splicing ligase RtcB
VGRRARHGRDAEGLEHTEEGGTLDSAVPALIGKRARERGAPQFGTLGSGNHFLEVQAVEEIYDAQAASVLGLAEKGQVAVLIHCG